MAMSRKFNRCQVSIVTEMRDEKFKDVLHTMVAMAKGDKMQCMYSNETFQVSYHPDCAIRRQGLTSLPAEGTRVTLIGFATPDGMLEVVNWRECCKAEHDAHLLERVVAKVRARKQQQQQQQHQQEQATSTGTESLWDEDAGHLDNFDQEEFLNGTDNMMIDDEVVSDSSYDRASGSIQPKTEENDAGAPCDLVNTPSTAEKESSSSQPEVSQQSVVNANDAPINTGGRLQALWSFVPRMFGPSGDSANNHQY